MSTETKTSKPTFTVFENALLPMTQEMYDLISHYLEDKGFDNFLWETLFEKIDDKFNLHNEDTMYASVHLVRCHWSRTGSWGAKKEKWTDADKQTILDFYFLGSLKAQRDCALRYERDRTLRERAKKRAVREGKQQ